MNTKFKHLFFYTLYVSLVLISCNSDKKPIAIYTSWRTYRGNNQNNTYYKLDQINTNNVINLDVSWIYRTEDNKSRTSIQCNPIIINEVYLL